MEVFFSAIGWLDSRFSGAAVPVCACLAVYILLSGLDDAVLDVLWLRAGKRLSRRWHDSAAPEKRIVILVPLWKEAAVIETMLEHNTGSIRYGNYEILAGVYANDGETRRAVERAAARFPQVHVAEVPHDGPTSKADCLNWIYQRLLEREMDGRPPAEVIMVHDAEDLIHPDSLRLVSRLTDEADMVQVPVLALATPMHELTHGVYCDDFAESQTKDLAVRAELGAFLPGCGVGTAFRRDALERLAERESNRLFDPFALTEDYDNGLRLHGLGCRQLFVPLQWRGHEPVATREYFPRSLRAAVRQRTRWVTGNCLQAWQRHGWGRGLRRPWLQAWFFWRDRKVLWGSWIGLATNLLFLWAAAGWAAAAATGAPWRMPEVVASLPWLGPLLAVNLILCCERLAVRMYCSGRIYGWWFAAGAPVRMLWGNLINAAASARAVWQFSRSLWTGQPLRWLKTEHCYPSLASLRTAASPAGCAAFAAAAAAGASAALFQTRPEPAHDLDRAARETEEDWAAAEASGGWPESPAPLPQASPAAHGHSLLRALPPELCDEFGVVPLRLNGGCVEVAASAEFGSMKQRAFLKRAGVPVRFVTVPAAALEGLARKREAPSRRTRRWAPPPGSPGQWLQPLADEAQD